MSSSGGSLAVIAVGYERHCGDGRVEQLSALLKLQLRAGFGKRRRDIAHGDRALQRRREAAARDLAELIALIVEDQSALANRLAALDVEADALLGRTILDLGEDAHRSGKP